MIYQITIKVKKKHPAYFYVNTENNAIFTDCHEYGFFWRKNYNIERLKDHLQKMVIEGGSVSAKTVKKIKPRYADVF